MNNNINITFKLDGVQYATPNNIKKVKIVKYLKYLSKVFKFCPKVLNDVCILDEGETIEGNFNKLSQQDKKTCYDYYIKVVSFWTGAPEQKLKSLDLKKLELAFWGIEFLFGGFTPNPDFVGFEVDGIEYLLPKEHMAQSTLIEFAECAEYEEKVKEYNSGNHYAMLDLMAILCRPKGEEYDEHKNPERKRIFGALSLDVGLNVCFFLNRLNITLGQILLIYSLMAQQTTDTLSK